MLVTGAGGSIGAELCRQIARIGCKRLILVEQGETPLFEIERELVDQRGFPPSVPVLADAGNRQKMRRVFERYTPGVVFHAAAYKHVPLMEANPLESVRNNTLVTRTMAEVAIEFEARRFVLVSTDKAVNPKTVMGQSKALCEWLVEAFGHRQDIPTRFVAVRFGNVLGSSGSVIPIFRRQIERGGPVTVTHPEMTRFFMTIPEAVSLIVQAGAIGGRGEVFVLDMGEPVRIIDLARNMIELSGKEPERDIRIEFIGARPGEKLHEELWSDGETVSGTGHAKIHLVTRPSIDAAWLDEELGALERLVDEGDTLELVAKLAAMMKAPRRVPVQRGYAASRTVGPLAFETSHVEVERRFLDAALVPASNVLDAGCGRTTRLRHYRDRIAELTGADLDAEAVVRTASLDRFVVADLCRRLPFEDGGLRSRVRELRRSSTFASPEAAFGEWRRVLRPGGSLVFVTSNRASPLLAIAARSSGPCSGCARSGVEPEPLSATSFPRSTERTPRNGSRRCSSSPASNRSTSPLSPPCTGTRRSFGRSTACCAHPNACFPSSARSTIVALVSERP